MKKFLILSVMCLFCIASQAQLAAKIHTSAKVNEGSYISFNPNKADTLKSGDTISYVFPVTHINRVVPVIDLRSKLVASDTIIDVKYWGSMDGITYYQVYAGSSPAVWVTTIAKGAAAGSESNGYTSIAYFGLRYFKIMFIARANSGFKKIPYGYVKFDVN
jgi:hypothetical protein